MTCESSLTEYCILTTQMLAERRGEGSVLSSRHERCQHGSVKLHIGASAEWTRGRAPGGWVTVWEKAASCEMKTDRCMGVRELPVPSAPVRFCFWFYLVRREGVGWGGGPFLKKTNTKIDCGRKSLKVQYVVLGKEIFIRRQRSRFIFIFPLKTAWFIQLWKR